MKRSQFMSFKNICLSFFYRLLVSFFSDLFTAVGCFAHHGPRGGAGRLVAAELRTVLRGGATHGRPATSRFRQKCLMNWHFIRKFIRNCASQSWLAVEIFSFVMFRLTNNSKNYGLDELGFQGRVTHVFHSAARVNLTEPFDMMRKDQQQTDENWISWIRLIRRQTDDDDFEHLESVGSGRTQLDRTFQVFPWKKSRTTWMQLHTCWSFALWCALSLFITSPPWEFSRPCLGVEGWQSCLVTTIAVHHLSFWYVTLIFEGHGSTTSL